MAKEKAKEQKEQTEQKGKKGKNEQEQNEQEQKDQTPKPAKMDPRKRENLIAGSIMGGVILVFALSGFFLGEVLVETLRPEPIVAAQMVGPSLPGLVAPQSEEGTPDPGKTWFYDLDPVVANLDEPGATRYIRTSLTLEVFDSLNEKDGRALLKEKSPHLRNWLAIYLASLSLEDARGERNLRRMQSDVLEEFNQILFPNALPHVNHILLKDFAIQ